ncbi:2,3-epoxybenzoyl-CoA dihydrolase [Inmirania thermothiophila]|uniref:2,3-dihydro-2,3-dihydroxybenzoyl-CoA ring cleavage enzyme n=1 Tax=Inmirania thermothiophila TaxID=1750597 RepID=A0A3N1Y1R3_9GAMM|nr:2,3-epoxybenzoyl-CoA dihydrolase [Inmirania thermothiophila]ROR32461.1 2,3-dihydro-2,3-dihydroxybenzoyl-CoA ring cleavage enzyme [Inmirania thermothiophila]
MAQSEQAFDTGAQAPRVDFQTHPDRYRHWRLEIDGRIALLSMDVQEDGGLRPGYELKLNSYDLGVDIELYDAVQRLRFEHPEVGAVIIASGKGECFCAGANIRMLGQSSHEHKVNFCKFTNETRLGIEDATAHSGQTYLTVVNGVAAGGGYELALATDYILMADDGSTAVSLPEVPLLAVLPGTGGLTRLVDKRKVRRDLADVFCTIAEGIKGRRAVEWGLVDELAPKSRLMEVARERAAAFAARSDRPADGRGVELAPLERRFETDAVHYPHVSVRIDRAHRVAYWTVRGPQGPQPQDPEGILAAGAGYWPLALARELDDAILHMRLNEDRIGTWVLRTEGDAARVLETDAVLLAHHGHWLVREIVLYLKRTLKRLDVTSRSLFAFIEPGSCFAGTLLELALAADRSYMLDGTFEDVEAPAPTVVLGEMNFGPLPMGNGLSRLETRFLGDPARVEALRSRIGEPLDAAAALEAGLVTFAPDDIDWEDEVRLAVEERASFSPDALTGMEANLRFAGPETLETKIFGRLSAWQNWIFQRPNAAGPEGALRLYGTGRKPNYDRTRV